MPQPSTVHCGYDSGTTDYCPIPSRPESGAENKKRKERIIGSKPNFENGYVTMNEDGLAIAMIPKSTEQ